VTVLDELVDATAVRPVSDDRLRLGEGLRVLEGGDVVLVDLLAGRLLRLPERSGEPLVEVLRVDGPLGAVAPLAGRPGHWLAAVGTGFAVLDPRGRPAWLARPGATPGPPRRVNDAGADPSGAFWGGIMPTDETEPLGSVHRVARDGTVTELVADMVIPNGPVFSGDGRLMYLADTPRDAIDVFDLDPATGTLSGRRSFARTHDLPGHPDGMLVDGEGRLWAAMHGGSCVAAFAPDGTVLGTVPLPARQPTSVAFTGEHLLVTTKIEGLEEVGPPDGAVLALPSTVAAAPATAAVLDPR
jgi:sugar lactone lactonase YvrE